MVNTIIVGNTIKYGWWFYASPDVWTDGFPSRNAVVTAARRKYVAAKLWEVVWVESAKRWRVVPIDDAIHWCSPRRLREFLRTTGGPKRTKIGK
jgi:hypothetical protein